MLKQWDILQRQNYRIYMRLITNLVLIQFLEQIVN